jgi:hypothetical protein
MHNVIAGWGGKVTYSEYEGRRGEIRFIIEFWHKVESVEIHARWSRSDGCGIGEIFTQRHGTLI